MNANGNIYTASSLSRGLPMKSTLTKYGKKKKKYIDFILYVVIHLKPQM